MSYITIEEAAYLMGLKAETVKEMVKSGSLLAKKFGETLAIHESEMGRFQHPWVHIFRLDERINAQQALVETLKGKINARIWEKTQVEVHEIQSQLVMLKSMIASFSEKLAEIETAIKPLFENLPGLIETVNGLKEAADNKRTEEPKRRMFSKRKK